MPKRRLRGTIKSTKMKNTVVVEVEKVKQHSKYKKRFMVHKKYKAHTNQPCHTGDSVIIQECRPISKEKKWEVIKILNPKS